MQSGLSRSPPDSGTMRTANRLRARCDSSACATPAQRSPRRPIPHPHRWSKFLACSGGVLAQLHDRTSRDEHRLAVGLLEFYKLGRNVLLAFLEERLHALQDDIFINNFVLRFAAVNVVALAQV